MAIATNELGSKMLKPLPETKKDLAVTTEPVGHIPPEISEPAPFTATPGEWMRWVGQNSFRNRLLEAEKRAQEALRGTF